MATTPLGLPLIPDSTKISAFPAEARALAIATDDALANHTVDERGVLPAGTNLNSVMTPGFYRSDTAANVATFGNLPAGTREPFTLEVRELSRPNRAYLQTLSEWTSTGPKISQRLSNEAVFAPWTLSPLLPWARGLLAEDANLDKLTYPGVYDSGPYTAVATMAGLPAGTKEPFTLEVRELSKGNGVYLQTITEWSSSGPKTSQRLAVKTVYSGWKPFKWDRGILPAKTNLSTLTAPGVYQSDRSTNVATITGLPAGVREPFALEVLEMSEVNGVYLQTLSAWTSAGLRVFRRISLKNIYGAWESDASGAAPETASRLRVAAFGDSLTAGGSANDPWSAGQTWPDHLRTAAPGITVTNMGRGGDTTDEVLLRAGALVLNVTIPMASIPASGAVTLATRQKISTRANRTYTGTLAGVPGRLATTNADGGWQFTRTTAGTAVPVPGQVPFLVDTANLDTDTLVFWAGRNDVDFGTPGMEQSIEDHVIAQHQRFLDWARPRNKSVVFAGVTTGLNDRAGSAKFQLITRINDRLRYMFPGYFADVQRWLVNDALAAIKLTPTTADRTAMAAGEIPPQLFADTVHFTRATAAGLGSQFFESYLKGKGLI